MWAVAGAVGALAFALEYPISGSINSAVTGPAILLPALAAAVVARLESLPVAFAGALVLGIIDAVVSRSGVSSDKVMLTVERYGNMSAATVPVALAEALEEGRVKPGALILMPAFGAGLTVCAHLVRWGERVTPLGQSDADLPPNKKTALELINGIRSGKMNAKERSGEGLRNLKFIEQL